MVCGEASHLFSCRRMTPPSATDSGSKDERDNGNDTENERRRLPFVRELALLGGSPLLFTERFL